MDNTNTKKNLIRKYINKQCTPQELQEIKKLMNSPGIDMLFEEVLSETWTELEAEQNIDQPHLNTQLNKFYNKLGNDTAGAAQQEAVVKKLNWRKYLSYAAVWTVVIMGFAGYRLFRSNNPASLPRVAMREIANPYGKRSKIILPDSSEVYLGAGSKLTVPESFTGNTRTISLQGEAFFQVTKNPAKPFIIRTGTIQTRVLGTSFKVDAFEGRAMEVAVVTGKVRVDQFAGGKQVSLAILTPGQKMTYANKQATVNEVPINDVSAWQDGKLVFKNQKMSEITEVLERWFNVKFQYKNAAKADERISITLQGNAPLNKIMKVLSATGHFKFSIDAKTVIIK
ncbi:FecR family protein [Mucilaginibacter gynuensis]|uniref:FecR family protein n=1 Tax=Mucilaginibacter gynuensis TaxID=1302236 RepID=A0ABP8G698_9SPHI